MYQLINITARIELFKGKGFRQTPFVSGYRPLFNFPGAETKISGRIDLNNVDNFSPGENGIVRVSFIKGIISDSYFQKAVKFTFGEGRQTLGEGEIL